MGSFSNSDIRQILFIKKEKLKWFKDRFEEDHVSADCIFNTGSAELACWSETNLFVSSVQLALSSVQLRPIIKVLSPVSFSQSWSVILQWWTLPCRQALDRWAFVKETDKEKQYKEKRLQLGQMALWIKKSEI